jgi:hypothetical protein
VTLLICSNKFLTSLRFGNSAIHIPTTSRTKTNTTSVSATASCVDLLGLPLKGFGILFIKQIKTTINKTINAMRAYNIDGVFNAGKTFVFDDVVGSMICYYIIIRQ